MKIPQALGMAEVNGRRIAGWCLRQSRQHEPIRVHLELDGRPFAQIVADRHWRGPLPSTATHPFCGFSAIIARGVDVSRKVVLRAETGEVLLERTVHMGFFRKSHLKADLFHGRKIEGWAWHPDQVGHTMLTLSAEGVAPVEVRGNRFRPDLFRIGLGPSLLGFSVDIGGSRFQGCKSVSVQFRELTAEIPLTGTSEPVPAVMGARIFLPARRNIVML